MEAKQHGYIHAQFDVVQNRLSSIRPEGTKVHHTLTAKQLELSSRFGTQYVEGYCEGKEEATSETPDNIFLCNVLPGWIVRGYLDGKTWETVRFLRKEDALRYYKSIVGDDMKSNPTWLVTCTERTEKIALSAGKSCSKQSKTVGELNSIEKSSEPVYVKRSKGIRLSAVEPDEVEV